MFLKLAKTELKMEDYRNYYCIAEMKEETKWSKNKLLLTSGGFINFPFYHDKMLLWSNNSAQTI